MRSALSAASSQHCQIKQEPVSTMEDYARVSGYPQCGRKAMEPVTMRSLPLALWGHCGFTQNSPTEGQWVERKQHAFS